MTERMWEIKLDRIDVGERVIVRSDNKAAARDLYKSTLRGILNAPNINDTMLRSISLVEKEELDEFLTDGGTVLSQFTWHRSAEADPDESLTPKLDDLLTKPTIFDDDYEGDNNGD